MTQQPDPAAFRAALRQLAGACSLITIGAGEARNGLVATSVTSLSAEPPLILACINRASSSFPLFQPGGSFGLSILAADQQAVAERFSGQGGLRGAARFEGADWTPGPRGAPLLSGALVGLECEVEEMIARATHAILIGRITAIHLGPPGPALLYWQGRYRTLQP